MKILSTLFLLLFSTNLLAADIREFVGGKSDVDLVNTIVPGKSIFGIPIGTSEDKFIDKYGKPTGYIQMNQIDSGMIYGRNIMFLFENKKLSGIRIADYIVDWKISQQITGTTIFDGIRWRLDNGITNDMKRSEVKKILGDKLNTDNNGYQHYYYTNSSKVEIDFSETEGAGNNDEAYSVYGVTIEPK